MKGSAGRPWATGERRTRPAKELLDAFNALKKEYTQDSGYPSAMHYAWDKSDYEGRFLAQIRGDPKAMARPAELAERAKTRDVLLVCYEGDDKPCHRRLLLKIAQEDLGAEVDSAPLGAVGRQGSERVPSPSVATLLGQTSVA